MIIRYIIIDICININYLYFFDLYIIKICKNNKIKRDFYNVILKFIGILIIIFLFYKLDVYIIKICKVVFDLIFIKNSY